MADANRPKFSWYQHLWLGWPLVLIIVGGAIGGACGGLAWGANMQIFQKTKDPFLRYLWTGLISLVAVIAYFAVAAQIAAHFKAQQ